MHHAIKSMERVRNILTYLKALDLMENSSAKIRSGQAHWIKKIMEIVL